MSRGHANVLAVCLAALLPAVGRAVLAQAPEDPCEVLSIIKLSQAGLKIWSPDGQNYILN